MSFLHKEHLPSIIMPTRQWWLACKGVYRDFTVISSMLTVIKSFIKNFHTNLSLPPCSWRAAWQLVTQIMTNPCTSSTFSNVSSSFCFFFLTLNLNGRTLSLHMTPPLKTLVSFFDSSVFAATHQGQRQHTFFCFSLGQNCQSLSYLMKQIL